MIRATSCLAVLPVRDGAWLCRCRGAEVEPLAEVPGSPEARHALAPSGSALAVLDSNGKRGGLFRVLDQAPWVEVRLPFTSLPKGCRGHAVAATDTALIVGGHSRSEEALWFRSQEHPDVWRPIGLPDGIASRGKAVDGLHLDGARLLAVDDLVFPKWLVVYRMDDPVEPRSPLAIRLPEHIAYERILASALGPAWLGLLSKGISHGSQGSCLALVDRTTFQEVSLWSASTSEGLFEGTSQHEADPGGPPLLQGVDVGFAGDTLVVACGAQGLLAADLAGWTPAPASTLGPPLVPRPVPGLARVDRIVTTTPPDPLGVFLVGLDEHGSSTHVWMGNGPAERR